MGEEKSKAARPFFIVGASASGTTFLRALIHSHSHIAIPPEFFILPDLISKFGTKKLTPAQLRAVEKMIVRHELFHHLELSREEVAAVVGKDPVTAPTVYSRLFAYWAKKHQATRWGDKVPRHALFLDTILRAFPQAQIVHIVRDPRAVVASQIRRWRTPLLPAALMWIASVRAARRTRNALPANQFIETSYEQLVVNPETTIKKIIDFLGEQYEKQIFQFSPASISQAPQVTAGVNTSRLQAWEKELSRSQIKLIEWLCEPLLKKCGYQLTSIPPLPALARGITAVGVYFVDSPWLWTRLGVLHIMRRISQLRSGKKP